MREETQHLDSRPTYPNFKWDELGSQDYWDAITDINESYRNMLDIGKTKDVFRVAKEGVSTMLTEKKMTSTRQKEIPKLDTRVT